MARPLAQNCEVLPIFAAVTNFESKTEKQKPLGLTARGVGEQAVSANARVA